MNIKNGQFSSIEQAAGTYFRKSTINEPIQKNEQTSFEEILKQQWDSGNDKTDCLKFSKHAGERLAQRNITLSDEQLSRLKSGVDMASEKGIKESLVLMDSLAFIVSTKNNTVITAMEQNSNNDNVYTNIDGTVII